MYFVFDTETSGLPVFTRFRGYHNPKDFRMYDSSRIVSISWIVANKDMEVVSKETHIIKPDDFVIGEGSIAIHGITNETAHATGKDINMILHRLEKSIGECETIVAHNINFDVNILRSECYRYNMPDLARIINSKEKYCTMARGKEILRYHKNPKLSELYTIVCNEEITNAHDAEYDTWHCYKCFVELQRREAASIAASGASSVGGEDCKKRKRQQLSEEQSRVVSAPVSGSMLVLAGAGSGKTTTIVHRIKHLVDQGVPESAIVLTTFTKDAANSMEVRLQAVFGYKPAILVGTFDSISLRFLRKYAPDIVEYANVGEYAPEFLKLLNAPGAATSKVFLKEISHLFVDEFQDINQVQFDIIDTFYKHGAHVTGIGDDAQNIFAFRGSDIRFISSFSSHFQGAETYVLAANFRSSKQIIDLANAVIACDKNLIQKQMHAAGNDAQGIRPALVFCDTHAAQCALVCDKIKEYCRNGYKPSDIAVLCPQNQFLFGVEELLTSRGIPNVLLDGRMDVRCRPKPDHVCLSTIHKAKGLEWDVVFLIMMNDDVLPARKDEDSISEGRRLFYVGVTRPRKLLHLYFSTVYSNSSVTRYVSDLDYTGLFDITNCKSGHFLKSTKARTFKTSRQLKALLRNISNEQLAKIRQFMPSMQKRSEKLHPAWQYPEFVTSDDMYEEYENFIRLLVQKMVAEEHPNTENALVHPSTARVTSGVVLDYSEAIKYNRYKYNFKDNLSEIGKILRTPEDIFSNRSKILSMFMNGSRVTLQGQDVSVILGIIYKMKKSADKNNISLSRVSILNEVGLPDEVRRRLAASYACFRNPENTWVDSVPDMWQMAKCDRFVEDNRKRMFYKTVSREALIENLEDFEAIQQYYVQRRLVQGHKRLQFHVDVDDAQGLQGHAFAVLEVNKNDRELLIVKASMDDIVKPELVIEGVCLKAMMGQAGEAVRTVSVYNPMQGALNSYDIEGVDARAVLAVVSGA